MKIDNVIKFDLKEGIEVRVFTSFMFHKSNPDFSKLIEIYKMLEEVLNEEK